MKLNLLLILFIILGCNEVKKQPTVPAMSNHEESPDEKLELDSLATLNFIEIENNEFANSPLGSFNFNNSNLVNFFKGNYELRHEIIKNRYVDLMDTLILFKRNNSIVRFYKTKEKILLDSLAVDEGNFVVLKNNIDIGMSKQRFSEIFYLSTLQLSDSVIVSNDEGSSQLSILFKNGKIAKIYKMPW